MSFLIVLLFFVIPCSVFSQDTLLFEDFEDAEKPTGWEEQKVCCDGPTVSWKYQTGGHDDNPDTAAFGTYNACFDYQSYGSEATKLITCPVDISSIEKPELRFWHIQQTWFWGGEPFVDQLRVYYKRGLDSAWVMLEEYIYASESWVERIIPISDSVKSSTFYIAFEGRTQYGHGTCVDNVLLLETSIIPRVLQSYSIVQASTGFVASGTDNNPILRIDLKVSGNTGTVPFQALTVESGCDNDDDIKPNGVRLYYTDDTLFSREFPVGTAQSFSGGQAAFTGLNKNLSYGSNSIWVTLDIDTGITENNYVDAYINEESMQVQDTLYPPQMADPAGKRIIYNTIFFDDFERGYPWKLTGEFEKNTPLGLGGRITGIPESDGNTDPDYAFSGDTAIGTDLTGLGTMIGNYEKNDSMEYLATSPFPLDLYYYRDVKLTFQRYFNLHRNARRGYIDVSVDSGQNFTTVWNSYNEGGYFLDDTWKQKTINISNYVDGEDNVFIRFRLGLPIGSIVRSGLNIDDVFVSGDWVTKDVGVTDLLYPIYGCGFTDTTRLKVRLENYGSLPSPGLIPVQVSFNGGQTVTDTLYSVIPSAGTYDFTFTNYADLSDPAVYDNVVAQTLLQGDEDNSNDEVTAEVYALPTITPPHSQDFEGNPVFWRDDGNRRTLWELGSLNSYKIIDPDNMGWITGNGASYLENDSAYVESPCFDFSGLEKPVFEFQIWKAVDTASEGDGAVLQYSIDDGSSWNLVPRHAYSWDWNWYNNSYIDILGSPGWDSLTQDWITAKQLLPDTIAGQSSVKFRVLFMSDTSGVWDGIAFDDVKIYEAPPDVGVVSVDSIINNACQYANSPYISVTVKNFGLISLYTGEEIVVGLKANSQPVIVDTFTLSAELPVDDSITFKFTKPISLVDTGTYTITAYTLIEDDPYFYEEYNDTTVYMFSVKAAPIPGLPHIMYSVMPDTIVLRPYYNPDYVYTWHYDGSHDSVFHVPAEGVYRYTIENGTNGCDITDSVIVVKLVPDLAPDSLLLPVADCELSATEQVVARMKNMGTDTFDTGRQVVISYQVDSRPFVPETATLTQTVSPGGSFIYTFTTRTDLSTIGVTYNLNIAVSYPYDSTYTNDTLKNISVPSYGYPDPALGPDRAIVDTTYTLTTDPGYATYLWNDDPQDTLNTLIIRESGTYWVSVVDTFGCPGDDSVYIFLKVRDMELARIVNPGDTCFSGINERVTVLLRNAGSDTIQISESMGLYYSIDGGTNRAGTFIAGRIYPPGDSGLFTFTRNENFSAGNYDILCNVNSAGDFYPDNNTTTQNFDIYSNPVVNLGVDVDGLIAPSYTLDAGAGTGYSYLWWDGSTQRYYTVTAATSNRDHYVRVTNSYGCIARDTVFIYILVYDMGVASVALGDEICASELKNVTVQLRNYGNLNVLPNDSIGVGYEVNGYEFAENVILPGGLDPFQNVQYVFDEIEHVTTGANTIDFNVLYDEDINPPNDVLSKPITLKQSPDVDFGAVNDSLGVSLPYTLDAGAGYISYLWQDMSTGRTYVVTSPGWYSVRVENSIGCADLFSVYVDPSLSVKVSFAHSEISIYPNPVKEELYIRIDADEEFQEDILFELINIQGQVVWTGKQEKYSRINTLDVKPYPAGLYYLKLYNKENMRVAKIIIE